MDVATIISIITNVAPLTAKLIGSKITKKTTKEELEVIMLAVINERILTLQSVVQRRSETTAIRINDLDAKIQALLDRKNGNGVINAMTVTLCPSCGRMVDYASLYCWHCGKLVVVQAKVKRGRKKK